MSDTMDWSAPVTDTSSPEPTTSETPETTEPKETAVSPREEKIEPTENTDNTPNEEKPKKAIPRMIKVGEETVSEEELVKSYGKNKGADAKFREAAEARKSVDAFMEQLQADPMAVLNDKRIPLDRRKLAEEWLAQELEAELEDPRDRKLREYEARDQQELERAQQEEMTAKEQQEQAEFQKTVEKRKTEIQETLSKAMEATSLSKHPETAASTLREMALYMRAASEAGAEVSPEALVQHVEGKRFKEMYSVAQDLEGEDLISFLGDDVVKKIRKADLARLKGSTKPQPKQTSFASSEPKGKAKHSMTPWEAKEHANKMLFGE